MSRQTRYNTKYPGVYYIEGRAIGSNKPERIFYIRYRKNGKSIEEKVGKQFQDDMTPARASQIKAKWICGGKSNKEKQEEAFFSVNRKVILR